MENSKTVEAFARELAEFYADDPIAAGIQIAWLPDKRVWYCCIHRFPTNNVSKRVYLAKATLEGFQATVDHCYRIWQDLLGMETTAKALAAANSQEGAG